MDGWMDGWMDRWFGIWREERTDGRMNIGRYGGIDTYLDR